MMYPAAHAVGGYVREKIELQCIFGWIVNNGNAGTMNGRTGLS